LLFALEDGQMMGRFRGNHGKSREVIRKSWVNDGKPMGKSMKMMGIHGKML
jgi:hypothetical protein